MSNSLDLIEIIKLLQQWKWKLLIVIFIAGIIALIASMLMDEYYESSMTFYPANPEQTNRNLLFQKETNQDMATFGDKQDVDRLITMGKSGQIISYCIAHFKLWDHYKIDSTSKYAHTKMQKRFKENFNIFKNEYGAIEVHVLDTDAKQAAAMANAIVDKIDAINIEMISSNKNEIVKLFESLKIEKQIQLQIAQDSLRNTLNTTSDTVKINILRSIVHSAISEYNDVITLLNQNQAAASKNLSSIFVVERAYPSDKKAKPNRMLIVLSTMIITGILSSAFVVLYNRFKEIDFKSV